MRLGKAIRQFVDELKHIETKFGTCDMCSEWSHHLPYYSYGEKELEICTLCMMKLDNLIDELELR